MFETERDRCFHGKTSTAEKAVRPRQEKIRKTETSGYYDYSLLAVIILLTCFGLIMLYSTSSYMAEVKYGDDMYFFKKQALISAVCIVAAVVISKIDYHILGRFTTILYVSALFLMALVKITPLGQEVNGARRWLKLGIQFQPAEIAKIAVIVCLPYMIINMGRQVKTLKGCMRLAGSGGLLAAGAYILTENLSTAIIIFGITAGLIFMAHPNTKLFLSIVAVGVVLVAGIVIFLYLTVDPETNENFRIGRILVWLRPEEFADGIGISDSSGSVCHRLRADFWEEDWETVSRSWEVFQRRRTI